MYRLLIVDDEPPITNALYEVFQGIQSLELDIYKAYSGEKAMELLTKTKVDIVLTDIRMPRMDGLQLLENIRQEWPQCRVILLTGHNDFDYIYRAIQYKGVSYLLKTEGYDKIIKTVEDTVKEIDNSLKMENILRNANEQMALASSLLQKDLIMDILKGKANVSDLTCEQFENLGLPLDPSEPVLIMIGRFDNLHGRMPYTEKLSLFYSVKLIADRHLSCRTVHINILDENDNMVWILQPILYEKSDALSIHAPVTDKSEVWHRIEVFVKGTAESIQASCKETLGHTVSLAMCNEAVKWAELGDKYIYLNQLLNYKSGSGTEMILLDLYTKTDCLENHNDRIVMNIQANLRKLDKMRDLLERGQSNEFFEILDEVSECFKGIRSRHYNPALEAYYAISVMLLSCINRWNLSENIAFSIGLSKLTHIDEHDSWEDAVEYFKKLAQTIFKLQADKKEDSIKDIIERLHEYITEHINQDLSLINLAEYIHFNPSYLSRLYKQITNENLSDYILQSKIAQAKLLLRTTDLKIHKVAEAVGYNTAQSFTRFFKKIVKMTPEEYRG